MRLTIDALATTNLSGGFVISGHLKQWLEQPEFDAVVSVLCHENNRQAFEVYGDAIECESFGIPSVEAQAFGNPVVTSDRCAMPEVCGAGGRYATPGDVTAVATTLAETLADRSSWDQLAAAALENTRRFDWNEQARKLYHLLEACVNEGAVKS